MEFFWIFLVLALVVTIFGFGVVIAGRRRSGTITEAPPARPLPRADTTTDTLPAREAPSEAPVAVVEPETAEPEPAVVEPVKPASLRDRLAKARSAFTGAFTGVLGRTGITDETCAKARLATTVASIRPSATPVTRLRSPSRACCMSEA